MAAHRFWRIHISKANTYATGFGEVVLAEEYSGPQVAVGGVASASSEYSGSWVAANAFDGNLSTAWYSANVFNGTGSGFAYLQYDLGAGNAKEVVELRVSRPTSGFSDTDMPAAFVLMYSDDGFVWYLQASWSGLTFAAGETVTLDATPLPANQIFNRVVIDKRFRYNGAANVGEPTLRKLLQRSVGMSSHRAVYPARMTPWSGNYYIAGSTTVLGMPFARRVDLVEQRSGLLVRTFHTKADGAFLFDQIGPGPWTLIGVDNSAEQNSVVFAHVPSALMT